MYSFWHFNTSGLGGVHTTGSPVEQCGGSHVLGYFESELGMTCEVSSVNCTRRAVHSHVQYGNI